ncbi:MAG TPA: thiamine phosphate synthase [Pirellulaceae bacterium]|nr:thiamine phosphate synthase [Pirellulaceae bacterium]
MADDSSADSNPELTEGPALEEVFFRVLDAALNRASEGLRVVEDYARMVLEDRYLTGQFKRLRHDLVGLAQAYDPTRLIAARDTAHDVGTGIEIDSEYQRPDGARLIQANLARAQQALRTIEEYSKSFSAASAAGFERLRYDCYQLEKALLTTELSRQNLADARLCVLTDGRKSSEEFADFIAQLVAGGVDLIQLRDKSLDDRQLLQRGEVLGQLVAGTHVRWVMNDRADLAVAAKAHGVHLGQTDLPVRDARRIVGPHRLIGVSSHDIQQARQAVLDGANYIGVGPVFDSQTKAFSALAGLDVVRQVADEIALPAFAIGGIDDTNIELVCEAGMPRVAVSRAVCTAVDPQQAVRAMKRVLRPSDR